MFQEMADMSKKRILYIITKSNFGGAQRYVFELASNLPRDEFEVLVSFGGNGLLKEKLVSSGLITRTIRHFERDIDVFKEFSSMLELYRLMREIKPHIVHLNSSKAGGSGALVARLCGVRNIIFTVHGWPFYEPRGLLWRSLAWFFSYLTVLFTHRVVVVSGHDLARARMPFLRHKLVYIPTGVPEVAFKERHAARTLLFSLERVVAHVNDVWVVSTGEHTRNKNPFSLLRAIEKHNAGQRQKIFLTLMGDGEERQKLEQYVREHKLEHFVSFTGFIDDARSYLNAFDVFVLPSYKEGLPYALLEAGLAGLACIGSNVGGIPEVIEHEKSGLLIDPHDVESLVGAFGQLVESHALRAQFGTQLRAKVMGNYSMSTLLQKTLSLYRD